MHAYTETESTYTGKIGTHGMWEQLKKIMPNKARLKIFEIKKK